MNLSRATTILAGLAVTLIVASVSPGDDLDLTWHTVDSGGGDSSAGAFELSGTIGQAEPGTMTAGDFEVLGGFWLELVPEGPTGEGDCCVANGTPCCTDAECCAAVCAVDPFCCDVAWDAICCKEALELCTICAGDCPGAGECCAANGTPGCDDTGCCQTVCAVDPFCCTTGWDVVCCDEALALCDLCATDGCGSGSGDCCSPNGTPGCDDLACCDAICTVDPFCCNVQWDFLCAKKAKHFCTTCAGECCVANWSPGCNDAACQAAVCSVDPFCCSVKWDWLCAGQAKQLCETCQ